MRDPSYGVAAIAGPGSATGRCRRALPGYLPADTSRKHLLHPLAAPKKLRLRESGCRSFTLPPHVVSIYRAIGHATGYPRPFHPYRHGCAVAPLA